MLRIRSRAVIKPYLGSDDALKSKVAEHWNIDPCGARVATVTDRRAFFDQIENHRYQIEPYLADFASFSAGAGLRVLEVGVGAGTDHINWLRAGAKAYGIDLTHTAAALTTEHATLENLKARVSVADAENLPFPDNAFDIVYSYGVIHHTPATEKAVSEVHRVLRPGGVARVMIYHHPSVVGFLLWLVYGLARLRPWLSPRDVVHAHLESPGTKVYTCDEARQLFSAFEQVVMRTQLGPGDLLMISRSGKYQSALSRLAWAIYPRWLVRILGDDYGLGLLINAKK